MFTTKELLFWCRRKKNHIGSNTVFIFFRGNFSFKCHRDGAPSAPNASVYAVNAISFHPVFGTFATAGSDGGFTFWDKDSKQKLKVFNKQAGPISAATFNRNGSIYAYAVSYDWSKVQLQ